MKQRVSIRICIRKSPVLGLCCYLQNKMKINDWTSIQTLFDELNKRLDKTQKFQLPGVPRAYLRMMVELEDFLDSTLANKDVKKKMSKSNATALNTMRQRLKKHLPQYQDQINKFRENPESTEEEPESEEEPSEEGSEEGSDLEDEEARKVGWGWGVGSACCHACRCLGVLCCCALQVGGAGMHVLPAAEHHMYATGSSM